MILKVIIGGVGGQGVISAGILLAEAAVIHEGRCAVQSQSYGAEMRGGLSRTDVVIADEEVIYPKVEQAHVLVSLHRKALVAYLSAIRPGGLLLCDSDQSPVTGRIDSRQLELPFTAKARELGTERNANLCMLGALVAATKIVSWTGLEAATRARFASRGGGDEQVAALLAGYEMAGGNALALTVQGDSQRAGRHATSARM